MTKHAIILGVGSDIGRGLADRLRAAGWSTRGYLHDQPLQPEPWDLVVCCYGTTEPIGSFWDADPDAWERAFGVNLHLPVRQVRELYPHRRLGASACFFSGAGTSGSAPTYSAYAASKVALVKAVELMDDESEDCKFFVLGPGVVRTKIHRQAMRAGPAAANFQRVLDFVSGDDPGTGLDEVCACLLACVAAPKAAVGGRNVYVPLDDWSRLGELAADPDAFKLRRAQDDGLRRKK